MSHLFKAPIDEQNQYTLTGEVNTAQYTPITYFDGLTGLAQQTEVKIDTCTTGTAGVNTDGHVIARTGAGADGFATIRSRKTIPYRPGSSTLATFSAAWPEGGSTGYYLLAGLIRTSGSIALGYGESTEFGILQSTKGKQEIYQYQITAAASGTESITFTLDSVDFTLNVTSTTIRGAAAEIVEDPVWDGSIWRLESCDDKVFFTMVDHPRDAMGTFSFTNNSAGTLAATPTNIQNGQELEPTFITQANFNVDSLDGTGESGFTLDPTKMNIWQIEHAMLGQGTISYSVLDPSTQRYIEFHKVGYGNTQTDLIFTQPNMRLGLIAANTNPGAETGLDLSVIGSAFSGSVRGQVLNTALPKTARVNSSTNIAQGIYQHVLSVRNNIINLDSSLNKDNRTEVRFARLNGSVTISSGSRTVQLILVLASRLESGVLFEWDPIDGDSSQSSTDGLWDQTTGRLIADFGVSPNAPLLLDFNQANLKLVPGEYISCYLFSAGNTVQTHDISAIFYQQ